MAKMTIFPVNHFRGIPANSRKFHRKLEYFITSGLIGYSDHGKPILR